MANRILNALAMVSMVLLVASCDIDPLDEGETFRWDDETLLGVYGSTVSTDYGQGTVKEYDSTGLTEELTSLPFELQIYRISDDDTGDEDGKIFEGGQPEDRIVFDVSYSTGDTTVMDPWNTVNPDSESGLRYTGTRDTKTRVLFGDPRYVRTFIDVWRSTDLELISGVITITVSSTEDLDNPPMDETYSKTNYAFTGLVRDSTP
jgi:hypothetical protein